MAGSEEDDTEHLRAAIEHTLLAPDARARDVVQLCAQAREHRLFGVCVNPLRVELAARELARSGVRLVTVVGFPLGATFPEVKALECERAIELGAEEIDMVMDVGAALDGDWARVQRDIEAVVARAGTHPVKVILETAKLDDARKRRACQAAREAGARFTKTCTGFGGGGASEHDVALMHAAAGGALGVKASGGIRTREQALSLLAAGASRIGTSVGPALLR